MCVYIKQFIINLLYEICADSFLTKNSLKAYIFAFAETTGTIQERHHHDSAKLTFWLGSHQTADLWRVGNRESE